jgi:multidrug efflux system outer membrane protein
MNSLAKIILPTALSLLLGACLSVPTREQAPILPTHAPLAAVPHASGGEWPAADWWHGFGDPQLDALMQHALGQSPTLALAESRLEQARQGVALQRASGGLDVGASAQLARQRLSDNGLISSEFLGFNWYTQGDLGVQLQYDFDFWGRHRAAIEAAVDQARVAAAERDAAVLMLTSAVADTYFGWQTTQGRLHLADQRNDARQRYRDIVAARVARGIDNDAPLAQADAALAGAHEQRAELAADAELQKTALAALLGISVAQLPALEPRDLPTVSTTLPADVDVDLLSRRPDIAASRWRVEAAVQQREVVRTAFYPDFSLGALLGLSSLDLGKLFDAGSTVANVAPALHLPLFDAGRLHAQYGAANADLAAAVAAYDGSVVDAAHDAANQALQLQRIESRRASRRQQLAAVGSLHHTAQLRAERGLSDDRAVLDAEAGLIDQRDALLTLDGAAVSADIALIKALGGGYRDHDAAPAHATTAPTYSQVSTP